MEKRDSACTFKWLLESEAVEQVEKNYDPFQIHTSLSSS